VTFASNSEHAQPLNLSWYQKSALTRLMETLFNPMEYHDDQFDNVNICTGMMALQEQILNDSQDVDIHTVFGSGYSEVDEDSPGGSSSIFSQGFASSSIAEGSHHRVLFSLKKGRKRGQTCNPRDGLVENLQVTANRDDVDEEEAGIRNNKDNAKTGSSKSSSSSSTRLGGVSVGLDELVIGIVERVTGVRMI
jgi:hypothetical protein